MYSTFTRIFICIFLIFICLQSGAQPLSRDDIQKVQSLKARYPNDDVVGLTYNEKYTFSYKKFGESTSKVNVEENDEYEIMSLKARYYFSNAIFYDNESSVSDIISYVGRTRTYTSVSDKAYESNGYFHSDARLKTYGNQFGASGEKMRFKATKYIFDVKYFTSIYFHDFFPIETKTVTIEIPDWLQVELKEMNFEGYDIKKETTTTKNKSTLITYTARELIGKKNQSHVPGPSHILPHILILPKSYTWKDRTENLLASTADLYNWYHFLVSEVKNDPAPIRPTVEKLIAGKKTDDEKIKAMYYWVQDNIRYIAFENGLAGFKPASAQHVFEKRYGDCKGMANLLKTMLIIAGYDARLAWIGTRHIAYDYSVPSLCVDNHMICTVILNGKKIFLDGTEKFIAYQRYAHRIQSRPVLIEDGDKYILDRIPEYGNEANLVTEKRS